MRDAQSELLRELGEDLQRKRGNDFSFFRGARDSAKRTFTLLHDADVQVDDVVRSLASGDEFLITDVDKHVMGKHIYGITAHYETPRQRDQRIAGEQRQRANITISGVTKSILNISSQLQDVSQAIADQPPTDAATKAEVADLLAQLDEAARTASELTKRLMGLVSSESD